jgi:hypothetical protein
MAYDNFMFPGLKHVFPGLGHVFQGLGHVFQGLKHKIRHFAHQKGKKMHKICWDSFFFVILHLNLRYEAMKRSKDFTAERILLSDEQLDEVVGGAQATRRPSWLRKP